MRYRDHIGCRLRCFVSLPLRIAALGILFSAIQAGCVRQENPESQGYWVGTWTCAPQLTEPSNLPPAPLANSTLRQFIHVTLGGKRLQARFSNAYGTNSVQINSARLALAAGLGSRANGEINPTTDRPLQFRGEPSINIAPGETVFSDPIDFDLPPLANLAVSIHFGDISATTINGHPGSRTTSFIQLGDAVSAASMPDAVKTAHWYILTGIDVWANNPSGALVILGDSITDGRGSTTDGNNRWPDFLARRLNTNAPTAGVAVLNQGIGGNGVFAGLGPAAVARFDHDVLQQNGVRWLIVFEGVNDIGGASASNSPSMVADLIKAYEQFIAKARERNIRIYGATITPFAGHDYFSPAHEAARQAVNAWIRTNNQFDAVIDFDVVVRNPVTLTNLVAAYDSGDGLHLNPAGYEAMANAVDLNLFTP